MADLSQKAMAAGASVLAWRASRSLRRSASAPGQQAKVFRHLASRMAVTHYGRANGIERGMAYKAFQARLPLQAYEQFRPFIERMKRGEADVLWPGQCAHYAVSSGTTADRTKYLPITAGMLDHFRKTGLDSLLYYASRVGHSRIFRGKHLFLGGATTLVPIPESAPFQAYGGDLSGIAALNLPRWVEKHLYEPGTTIAQMSDWPTKIAAIIERTWSKDLTMIAGIPSWILILAEQLRFRAAREGRTLPHLQALWPNLECLVHGGVPITPFAGELRTALGPTVNFHEVYPASEGFIAAQDATSDDGLRLMTNAGIFYEFLPMSAFDEANLGSLGTKAVPLDGVQPNVDYALLMTTPAGLSRYVIGDIVRFISTEPARLIYVGRTQLQLSAFGEHVIEKEVTDSLQAVCQRHGWQVVNFHVAPIFADSQKGERRGRHEWWIELKGVASGSPDPAQLSAELDPELQRRNDDYEAKRKGGGLETPVVRLAPPGLFEKWLRQQGKWGGQNKTPRCRSDRKVADGLARLMEA